MLLLVWGCAAPSGVRVPAIAEPDIAAAYLPLQGRALLGLVRADGAAVVIAPGIAVTNAHNDNLVDPRTVLGFGTSSDLMFFRTSRKALPPTADPIIGQRVTAYGQDANAKLRIAHGLVCNIARVPGHADSPYFIFAGNAGPGFSGGPVVDDDGRLIGITFAFVDKPKKSRLIFAYDMRRVVAEFQLKRPRRSQVDDQFAPAPVYGDCDRKF
ncbi:MAG TPA: serine protease [Rhizomicrobium sp.]|nr:serine protease [Rhizomicrobium sp.]